MPTINPYLTFDGNCEEAFNFYKSIFKAEFRDVNRFSEMPPNPEQPLPAGVENQIMHISMPISEESVLMGSDAPEGFAPPFVQGNNINISINTTDVEEGRRLFEGLSDGGQIMMPFEKTFWGAVFGMTTDKFGIHWMINCDLEE